MRCTSQRQHNDGRVVVRVSVRPRLDEALLGGGAADGHGHVGARQALVHERQHARPRLGRLLHDARVVAGLAVLGCSQLGFIGFQGFGRSGSGREGFQLGFQARQAGKP